MNICSLFDEGQPRVGHVDARTCRTDVVSWVHHICFVCYALYGVGMRCVRCVVRIGLFARVLLATRCSLRLPFSAAVILIVATRFVGSG